MLRNTEDVRRNQKIRVEVVQEIVLHQHTVDKLLINDPADRLTGAAIDLAEAHFHLYQLNKEYDEYFETLVNPPSEPKSIWQKLLGK